MQSCAEVPPRPELESLIVLSDVHLGADLVSYAPPGATPPRTREVDDDLVRLLDHYRCAPPPRGRWRLVIAGDLIDFIGMALPPDGPLRTEPTPEERLHGLGSAADHAALKMRAVAERHRDVFATLARFVAAGHALTIIHGNHDLELHWEEVRRELLETLATHASTLEGYDRDAFLARIDFSPWFFHQEGVVYIEHGHQYDAFCSTDHLLAPLSPVDPRRTARSFADVLLRFVVRQTDRVSEHGHEALGVVQYVALAGQLGLRGGLALFVRYLRALRELFRLRHEYLTGATAALRLQHEEGMARLAEARRVSLARLRSLCELHVPPITRTIPGILASLLVDRLALAAACMTALLGIALTSLWQMHAAWTALAVPVVWLFVHRYLARRRPIEAAVELAARAPLLARLFEAPLVVMGHTHVPERTDLGHATYINLGSWAESEGDSPAPRAHLVIHPADEGPIAELLRWDSANGPTRFAPLPDAGNRI